jgi:thiamine-monophosphate kinase
MSGSGGGRAGEFDLIGRYFRPLAANPAALGLADDAALLRPAAGEEWVVTNDMLVESIHFLEDPPGSVAAKALRVNLSDLAAKGATPMAYLLGLGLSERCDEAWVAGFAAGLAADQARFGIQLIGGDTVRTVERITISVTAMGRVAAGAMVHRSGARPGDVVFVSGTIGDAALGVRIRLGRPAPEGLAIGHLLDRYLHPQPRVALAPVVARHASASMDVSDGLVGDLGHICAASGVSAEIDAGAVPLSEEARAFLPRDPTALATILGGGDDYEILATVPPDRAAAYAADAAAAGVPVTAVGRILAGAGTPVVLDADRRPLALVSPSWVHF